MADISKITIDGNTYSFKDEDARTNKQDKLTAGDNITIENNIISAGGGGSITALDIYPVGSIYMSINSTSPATLFGGTWERLYSRFLIGADGGNFPAGDTGGEYEHTLTVNEIPSHRHDMDKVYSDGSGSGSGYVFSSNRTLKYRYTSYTGGGSAHNNTPPYLAVYMWKRTA